MFAFDHVIREMDAELKREWQPGAFNWADKHMGDKHKKAIDRFDAVFTECIKRFDFPTIQAEAEIYKSEMLEILRAYKTAKQIDETESFLNSLEKELYN